MTPVLRGCVLVPSVRDVSKIVEEQFGHAAIQVVSFANVYAGKIVAALHRQYPRDLFDVRELLLNEGIDERLRDAFIVYLISHYRPMAKLLAPVPRDMTSEFTRGLAGLTEYSVTLDELVQVREELVNKIVGRMSDTHRRFLLSFQKGEPEWAMLDVPHANTLPAVRWRLTKLRQLDEREYAEQIVQLESVLAISSLYG